MCRPPPLGRGSVYAGSVRGGRSVSRPVLSGITKWVYRRTSQEVCPWNGKFAQALPEGSPFAPRAMFVDADARTLAREILAMDQADYAAAYKGSAMKRAKLWRLQRNAAVVIDNVGASADEPHLLATAPAPKSESRARRPAADIHTQRP